MIRYCDCCSDNRLVKVSLKDVFDNTGTVSSKYDIVTCLDCGNSFLSPMPKEYEIPSFYSKDYYAHMPNSSKKNSIRAKLKLCLQKAHYGEYSGNKAVKFFQKIIYHLFRDTINEPPIIVNGKLLDVGCGNGEYLNLARRFGWDVYGVEPNRNAVFIAKSMGLNVIEGTADKIEYEKECFDVVKMWNVLEHTVSPRKSLLETARVLKKGGYLLLYVPNFDSFEKKYFGKYWNSLEIPRHIHHFSFWSLKHYLDRTGFRVEKKLYPGTIVSTYYPSIKLMKDNGISSFVIISKSLGWILKKVCDRLLKRYNKDIGICLLAKKV